MLAVNPQTHYIPKNTNIVSNRIEEHVKRSTLNDINKQVDKYNEYLPYGHNPRR
jgi:hypothetical protein